MKKQAILFFSVVCIFSMMFSTMALANEEVVSNTEEENNQEVQLEEKMVARIVRNEENFDFATLKEAYEAAEANETIVLLESAIGEGIVIKKPVTIDLNDKTYTFTKDGVGSGTLKSNGFQILKDVGTENRVTIKNGTLNIAEEAKSQYYTVIQNYANLTLEDVTIDAKNADKWSTVENNWDSIAVSINCGSVEIKGKTNIIENDDGIYSYAVDICKYASYVPPVVTIETEGKIEGTVRVWTDDEASESVSGTAELAVLSGVFTEGILTDWCADGFVPVIDSKGNATVAKQETLTENLVEVNGTGYKTITEAYNVAKNDAGTIKFIRSGYGEGLVIDSDVTIDFAGFTYTFTTPAVGSKGTESNGFQILEGHNVILQNGTLNIHEAYKNYYYMVIQNYSNLTLNNMVLDGTNLDKWSTTDGDSYTLSNNSGTVNITGTTSITANNEGAKAVAFDSCKYKTYSAPTVNVNTTGKITGPIEVSTGATLAISGGTFTHEIKSNWCAEGYEPKTNSDGTYGVIEEGKYLEVAGTKYATLQEAYDVAKENAGTITLLRDLKTPGLKISAPVTIDLAGFTCTFTTDGVGSGALKSNGFQILKEVGTENRVTIKNGTLNIAEEAKSQYYTVIQNYANLTLEDVTVDAKNADKWSTVENNWDSIAVSINCGSVEIKGKTNIIENDDGEYSYALDICKYASYVPPVVTIETEGKIDGTIRVWADPEASAEVEGSARLAISSGTYTEEILRDWCAEGLVPTQNGSAWTVRDYVSSSLSTNIADLTFKVGVSTEFTFTTEANDDAGVMVIGTSNFSNADAIEKLEYYEVNSDVWYPLTGEFGPATGFPMSDATSKFRVTFKTAGDYTFTASMKTAADGKELCKTEVAFTVAPKTVVSGGGGGGSSTPKFNVLLSKVENAKVERSATKAEEGDTVTIKVTPTENYEVAMFTVVDSSKKAVEVTEKNGTYTFVMPKSSVTVKVEMKLKEVESGDDTIVSGDQIASGENFETTFTDVDRDSVYYDAIVWAEETGVTNGTHKGKFSPERACTRAEIITALWRAAGSPVVEGEKTAFNDVDEGAYYSAAVAWAEKNGIAKGTTETTFDPDVICSRSEMVTFLWRSQNAPEVDAENSFNDIEIGSFYEKAVEWALKNSITTGTDANRFGPGDICDRGQMVTFLFRLYND